MSSLLLLLSLGSRLSAADPGLPDAGLVQNGTVAAAAAESPAEPGGQVDLGNAAAAEGASKLRAGAGLPGEGGAESGAWHVVPEGAGTGAEAVPGELPSPGLTPEQEALQQRLRRTLAYHYFRPQSAERTSPWAVLHAVIGFGVDTQLFADQRQVNAIAWLCADAPCYGMRLVERRGEQLNLRIGPGLQGHEGQFLSILAQSRVKADYPLVVDGQRMTIAELIHYEQQTCRPGTELTFKLISFAHYLDTDASWQDRWGDRWDLPRLIQEEIAQPVVGGTCGGTHRLTGFSYAVRKRARSGLPLDGQWLRAKSYLVAYHEYTFKLQNRDGSFSTNWFAGRGDWQDLDRRLETTGHTLEWLVDSWPAEKLDDPRLVRAVEYLEGLLWQYRGRDWPIGSLGHAIHALALYDERALGGRPGSRAEQLEPYRTLGAGPGAAVSADVAGPGGREGVPAASRAGGLRRRVHR